MNDMKKLVDLVFDRNKKCAQEVPSNKNTQQFVDDLIEFLFPVKSETTHSFSKTEASAVKLKAQFQELLFPIKKICKKSVEETTSLFFKKISNIYANLLRDAQTFLECDPAAYSVEEVILSYPGFYTIAVYRLAHILYRLEIPMLPRMMSEYAHSKTGIDIHPGAKIGDNFFIDHGTGIVIGETTIIGNKVKIYQGVTLGALFVQKDMAQKKRHPTIQDNVVIYAGSTILGGDTIIGNNTIIGGNVWLTSSVLSYSVVFHKSRTIVRDHKDYIEPINFVI